VRAETEEVLNINNIEDPAKRREEGATA